MGGRMASITLVGRVEELELLEVARGWAADGEPAVVLVGGEAGVGKTRLVAELTSRCATGTRVLVGGCVPVGDGALPYAPIVEALRGLLADLSVPAVRELVGPSWPELARLLPALGKSPRGLVLKSMDRMNAAGYCRRANRLVASSMRPVISSPPA
jgi:predicted ATPase